MGRRSRGAAISNHVETELLWRRLKRDELSDGSRRCCVPAARRSGWLPSFPSYFPFLLAEVTVASRFVYRAVAVGRSFVEMLPLYAENKVSVIDCLLEVWSFL